MIAAMDCHRLIGRDNQMPWHLPDDFKHFKAHTLNKPVIMGRKTFESIGQRPLPKRLNIVVSRQPRATESMDASLRSSDTGLVFVTSPQAALAKVRQAYAQPPEIMIMGGGELYRQFLPVAQRLYVTWVDTEIDGDAAFPEWNPADWEETYRAHHAADARHAFAFDYVTYERRH
ncbi:diacylglycerol kinase [Thiomicrospira sp. WB1]|nr:diacylglycerol kinase [Thiomicrospira sp. WB1]